jgi:hypothetical protein
MKRKKQEKQKIIYIDDGRTIVDMDIDVYPWYGKSKKKKDDDRPTIRERLAVLLGAYRAYLPTLIILICTLGILYLLCFLWLGH